MENNYKKKMYVFIILTLLCLIINIVFIIMLKNIDVKYAIQGSKIGFGSFNNAVFDALGGKVNKPLDIASTIILVFAFLLAAGFAVLAIIDLISAKSLKKIDKRYYAVLISFILLAAIYIIFNVVKINYRPVLIDGELKASFPSSHTLAAIGVFGVLITIIDRICKDNKKIKISIIICLVILSILMVVFRMLCGKHWATDVIGGVFFAALVILFNYSMIYFIKYKFD